MLETKPHEHEIHIATKTWAQPHRISAENQPSTVGRTMLSGFPGGEIFEKDYYVCGLNFPLKYFYSEGKKWLKYISTYKNGF